MLHYSVILILGSQGLGQQNVSLDTTCQAGNAPNVNPLKYCTSVNGGPTTLSLEGSIARLDNEFWGQSNS